MKLLVLYAVVLCLFAISAEGLEIPPILKNFDYGHGSKCRNISGTWHNELGSRMVLNVDAANHISGEYYTAVESNPEAAAIASTITGLFSKQKDGSLLAFTVLFNHGSSLVSWVGQCIVCEDKEVIYTTYTLKKYVSESQQKWESVTVNQNTFWRLQDSANSEQPPTKTRTVVSENHSGGLDLSGKWNSSDGSELHLDVNLFCCQGTYSTKNVIGRKDGNDAFTAVTLMLTEDKKISSMIGHIYNHLSSGPKILEMTGLEHEFSPSCKRPRFSVKFEAQNFTRTRRNAVFNTVKKSETFIQKLKNFFSYIF